MREKLIELQDSGNICPKGITSCLDCPYHKEYAFGIPCDEKAAIADRMIANGVTIPVRCKDCDHGSHVDTPEGRVWCEKMCRYMVFEGYCSYGKRRNKT